MTPCATGRYTVYVTVVFQETSLPLPYTRPFTTTRRYYARSTRFDQTNVKRDTTTDATTRCCHKVYKQPTSSTQGYDREESFYIGYRRSTRRSTHQHDDYILVFHDDYDTVRT